jgi:hypothetical protein
MSLLVLAVVLATIRLDRVPPVWWDEGWNFTIARNWVETGYYGRFLAGKPIASTPTNGFAVVAAVALGFKLFGIGIWQARALFTILSLGALMAIYHLATQLYGRAVGIGTIIVLLLMSTFPDLHPIIVGHQALGESPAMFFLLIGYTSFLASEKKLSWLMPAVFFWALAIITKLQVLPFWIASLLAPLMLSLYKKSYRMAGVISLGLIGGLLTSHVLSSVLAALINVETLPAPKLKDLYQVTAVVTALPARLFSLIVTVEFGIPTFLALFYSVWNLLRKPTLNSSVTYLDVVRLALLVLASSWFAWYITLSVGWVRYLFPGIFVGSIFLAAMLYELADKFDCIFRFHEEVRGISGHGYSNSKRVGMLLAVLIGLTTVPRTVIMLHKTYLKDADASVYEAARFINTETPENALVETYDSELFFLLKRQYHYPPDQLHVDLVRRTFLYDDGVSIDYDPLLANPDLLVVGPHSKQWHLYDPVLSSGAFQLRRAYKRYDLYERVR